MLAVLVFKTELFRALVLVSGIDMSGEPKLQRSLEGRT